MKTFTDLGTRDIVRKQNNCNIAQHRETEEIMIVNVVTTTPETTLYEAAKMMGEKHIGSLIVMKYNTAVGIITERDMLREVVDLSLIHI